MSNVSSQGPYTFEAVCFSTNFSNFSSISIMKQYFMSTECLDIEYKDEEGIEMPMNERKRLFYQNYDFCNNTVVNNLYSGFE